MNEYNRRLFSSSAVRTYYHNMRFFWSSKTIRTLKDNPVSVFELGCFDGRLLPMIDGIYYRYVGFDAGWENGLRDAQLKYINNGQVELKKSIKPDDLRLYDDKSFDFSVSLETMEHIDTKLIDTYFKEIARITRGYFLITVPNEIGLVFAVKHLFKMARYGTAEHYTLKEYILAIFGKTDLFERNEHKGFNYRAFINHLSKHFEIISVKGLPLASIPVMLGMTVSIIAKPK